MSELILTRPQQALVQKVASYFKFPQKLVREAVDRGLLEEDIMYFSYMPDPDLVFNTKFRCVEGKFNLGQILDQRRFQKSQLYQSWLNFISLPDYQEGMVLSYSAGGGVLAISGHNQTTYTIGRGEGAIILGYECLNNICLVIEPVASFLTACYPHPEVQ